MKSAIGYWLLVIGLTVMAVFSRLFPHPANFTAMGAIALFSGTYIKQKWGIILPLLLMLCTDTVLGFYEWPVMLGVYGSFLVVGMIGRRIQKNKNFNTVILGAVSASVIFFAVTNFVIWFATPWYPKTGLGLFSAYALAVPFFRNMLMGDLIYTSVLFGSFECLIRFMQKRPQAAVAIRESVN